VTRPARWIDRLLHPQRPVVLVKRFPRGPAFLGTYDQRGNLKKIKRNW
jgi:hypothetical protein